MRFSNRFIESSEAEELNDVPLVSNDVVRVRGDRSPKIRF